MLINREKSAHWYKVSGSGEVTPFFEVPKKDGKGMKAVTIREAREVGALASVTSILKVLAKPGLEAWRMEQGIISALTLPRKFESIIEWKKRIPDLGFSDVLEWIYNNPPLPIEDLTVFAKRVVEDSEKEGKEAGDFGTAIHDAISGWITNRRMPAEPVSKYLTQFTQWFETNIKEAIYVEKLVHHTALKYAGTMDFLGKLVGGDSVICDWKTQRVKRNAKGEKVPVFYEDSYPLQLCAYAMCDELVEPTNASWVALFSVIIDSSEPGPVYVKEWQPAEHYWKMFMHCLELWRFTKSYNV